MRRGAATGWFLAGLNTVFLFGANDAGTCVRRLPRRRNRSRRDWIGNLKTAQWMLAYDHAAWVTNRFAGQGRQGSGENDQPGLVLPGKKTTCGTRCTVATNQTPFAAVFCYRQISPDKFEKVKAPDFRTGTVLPGRSTLPCPKSRTTTRKTTVRFNYYVRGEADRIAIYYVPAFQTDGKARLRHPAHLFSRCDG